jgi:hypothetical protein
LIESILTSVKKYCHIAEDYEDFDQDIIMLINSNLRTLNQLGVGIKGFNISDKEQKWDDFLGNDSENLSMAKEFVFLNVRLIFDPPVGSSASAYDKRIQELTWRLNVQVDPKE